MKDQMGCIELSLAEHVREELDWNWPGWTVVDTVHMLRACCFLKIALASFMSFCLFTPVFNSKTQVMALQLIRQGNSSSLKGIIFVN